ASTLSAVRFRAGRMGCLASKDAYGHARPVRPKDWAGRPFSLPTPGRLRLSRSAPAQPQAASSRIVSAVALSSRVSRRPLDLVVGVPADMPSDFLSLLAERVLIL